MRSRLACLGSLAGLVGLIGPGQHSWGATGGAVSRGARAGRLSQLPRRTSDATISARDFGAVSAAGVALGIKLITPPLNRCISRE
jgi:hypothetical protein